METKHRQGFLSGYSRKAIRPNELIGGQYDLALLSSSWDKRCLCVTGANNLWATNCGLLLFEMRDNLGLRDKHDKALKVFGDRISSSCRVFSGSSSRIRILWNQLYEYVVQAHAAAKRPLRLFIDLSTCPRYLSLGLACCTLASGMASHVSVFYAEGNYPEEATEESRYELFTEGGWDAIPVPSLEGEWTPNKRRAYVVSVGFEGSKTLRLISREEPDDVYILFPDPGVRPEYVVRAWKRNTTLLRQLRSVQDDVVRANAGDAIEAWKKLDQAHREHSEEQNVYYVCCGTKPHSLALALRATVLKYPAVLYIVPDRHKVVDVEPLGVFWQFDLQDMTSV